MRKLFVFLFFAFLSAYFISCGCKGTILCGDGELSLRTVGFTMTDIDSMLLITYKSDNNFDSVIETQRLYNNNGYGLNNDTCNLDWGAMAGFDYKIVFPTTGDTFAITKMEFSGPSSEEVPYKCEEGSPQGAECIKSIYSYTVNGQTYATTTQVYNMVK